MAYRKEKFDNGDIAHLVMKGVEGRSIFSDENDYFRAVFSIYEFNDINPANIQKRRKNRNSFKKKMRLGQTSPHFEDNRDRMVDLLAFCFMGNHMHLLVRQLRDNGTTEYARKIGTGYGGYFNRKNNRKGHLFQDTFKAVKIKTDEQLKIVFAYIHTNPISLIYKDWKKIKIDSNKLDEVVNFVKNYKWSSCSDYIGINNFPSVTQRDFLIDLFGSRDSCKEFIESYIEAKGESKEYAELFLE
jgi:REP element-mobilizing transposase RayT